MKRFEKKSRLQRSVRRQRTVLLTEDQLRRLIHEVNKEPFQTMLIAAALLGLRRSEVAALKWQDFSEDGANLMVRRSVANGHVSDIKNGRHDMVPVPGQVAEVFKRLRATSGFNKYSDWVFADPARSGALPIDPEGAMRKYIRPAANKAGIRGVVSWHTFRHSFAVMLISHGIDIFTVSRLMRHHSLLTTEQPLPLSSGRLRNGSERLTSSFLEGPEPQASAGETAPKSTAKTPRHNFNKGVRKKNVHRVRRNKKARR